MDIRKRPSKTKKDVRSILLETLDVLSQSIPIAYPVKLRMAKIKDCYGSCDFRDTKRDGKHFLITIYPPVEPVSTDAFAICLETLLHEYAHAVSWFFASTDGGHGEAWACAYSACYRNLHGD